MKVSLKLLKKLRVQLDYIQLNVLLDRWEDKFSDYHYMQ